MTTPDPAKRPRQTTMAGWMIIIGSVFTVVTAFEVVGGARSLGTREAIERFLADPPGSTMGLDVETVVLFLQGTATAAAVMAAMTGVLGFYALRGDRRARTVLAALAVPLFLTGLAVGGFLTSLVAAACALLFVSPSREWFDGKPIPASLGLFGGPGDDRRGDRTPGTSAGAPGPGQHPGAPGGTPSGEQGGTPSGEQGGTPSGEQGGTPSGEQGGTPPGRPADRPYGTPYPDSQASPQSPPYATATRAPWAPAAPEGAPARPGRPASVSVAVALTLVMTSLVLLLSLVGLVAVLAAPDLMVDEMLRAQPDLLDQGLTRELIVVTAITTAVAMVLACLLAIGFAVALLTGQGWGATGLIVMCVLTVVFCMLAALSSLVALLPGIAALLVLTNVRHRDTRAWVRR